MSRHYVDELVKFQPEGTFLLGGYSVGATIALEMSHQLIAKGRVVSLLVVFDGGLFNTGGEISSLHPLYWLKLLLNVPRWMVDNLVKNHRTFLSRLKSAVFTRRNPSVPHALERIIKREGLLPSHAEFIIALSASHLHYVPDNYSGRVLVFVAKTQPLMRLRQVKAAWMKIAPSSEVFEIDGAHANFVKMPQGLPVAERLRKKIEEIAAQPVLEKLYN